MIEINNLSGKRIDKNLLATAAKITIKGEGSKIKDLSVALIAPSEMARLNEKYRKKKGPTDVLSFGGVGDEIEEVVICPEQVQANALESGESFRRELARVLVHGILHLSGYDHEKKKSEAEIMFALQEKYLSQIISK